MSTTTQKRSLAEAMADAEEFKALFPPECYERWEIAGSVRRGKLEIGDIEHVVIPRTGELPVTLGLFAQIESVNLLWFHLEAAMQQDTRLAKHLYTSNHADGSTTVSPRWGDKYRGVDFKGFNHEIFTATPDNWGCQLVIRTGPADFSKRVVTMLRDRGWCNADGYLRRLGGRDIIPVPDEKTYFAYCGLNFIAPEQRR